MKEVKAFYRNTSLFFTILAIIMLFGFDMVEGSSSDLSIGKASFLKMGPTPPPAGVKGGVFAKGEQVILFLENIGTFKEANGECWYDIDFSVETPEGESVFSKEGYLGDYGKDKLPNGILKRYNITVNPELLGIKPGDYVFKATIYDKIGGGKASVSKKFTIQN